MASQNFLGCKLAKLDYDAEIWSLGNFQVTHSFLCFSSFTSHFNSVQVLLQAFFWSPMHSSPKEHVPQIILRPAWIISKEDNS